jgi:signal peptidase
MKHKSTEAKEAEIDAQTRRGSKKAVNIIVNVVLILAIVIGIFCSFTAFISKRGSGVPSFFGIRPFAIQTDSMAPFFFKGDLVIDKALTDPAELKVGDIITYWTVISGERVLNSHRITNIEDMGTYLYFTTKGDNNTIEDAIGVHQSEIVGKYLTKIPKMGSVIDFLQTGTGFLLVILVPVFLFFVYHVVQFFKTLFAYKTEKMRLQIKKELEEKNAGQAAGSASLPKIDAAKDN